MSAAEITDRKIRGGADISGSSGRRGVERDGIRRDECR